MIIRNKIARWTCVVRVCKIKNENRNKFCCEWKWCFGLLLVTVLFPSIEKFSLKMFRFFRAAHLEPDQDQERQQRQPLLQSDQIPYQSSYDSISENEVVNRSMVDLARFDYLFPHPIKAQSLCLLYMHTHPSINLVLLSFFHEIQRRLVSNFVQMSLSWVWCIQMPFN